MNKNVEEFAPKPSEAVSAARNATENDFASEYPETKRLEKHMKEYVQKLDDTEADLLAKVRDVQKAKKHVLNALDDIEKAKS